MVGEKIGRIVYDQHGLRVIKRWKGRVLRIPKKGTASLVAWAEKVPVVDVHWTLMNAWNFNKRPLPGAVRGGRQGPGDMEVGRESVPDGGDGLQTGICVMCSSNNIYPSVYRCRCIYGQKMQLLFFKFGQLKVSLWLT